MPSDRTFVTELATGLGMLGRDPAALFSSGKPRQFVNIDDVDWARLRGLWETGSFRREFEAGVANGEAFLLSPDGLNRRKPRLVEWTGGRRPPGDEVVPADLRVDHVYLVSCKYLSRILHNPSPARLVDHLLAQGPQADGRDWYERVAPEELRALYHCCVSALGLRGLPDAVDALNRQQRKELAVALRPGWPHEALGRYSQMCEVVSRTTAKVWRANVTEENAQIMLWRLLRVGSAPYFILGATSDGSTRLRIDSPWDWRQRFRLKHFDVEAQSGGQPRVAWGAIYEDRRTRETRSVAGHVEIRWSHGRFGQPPEAKVYLDTPHDEVPGYHPLGEPRRSRRSAMELRASQTYSSHRPPNGPRQIRLFEEGLS